MDTYTIEITETLQKQIYVKSESYYDAIDQVREMYNKGKVQLTSENIVSTNFEEPVGCGIARQMLNRCKS